MKENAVKKGLVIEKQKSFVDEHVMPLFQEDYHSDDEDDIIVQPNEGDDDEEEEENSTMAT